MSGPGIKDYMVERKSLLALLILLGLLELHVRNPGRRRAESNLYVS